MKEFEKIIKNYDKIMLKLFRVRGLPYDYYELLALNECGSPIGRLGFELYAQHTGARLRNIRVVPQYLNKGVGHAMNGLFEQFLLQNNCEEISGVYYPDGIGSELAWPFYTHNGYRITEEDDDFHMLSKHIERDYNVPQFIEYETTTEFAKLPCERTK